MLQTYAASSGEDQTHHDLQRTTSPSLPTCWDLGAGELDSVQEHQALVLFDAEIAQGAILSYKRVKP